MKITRNVFHTAFLHLFIFLISISNVTSQTLLNEGITPDGFIYDMDLKGDILYIAGKFDKVGYQSGGAALLENDAIIPNLAWPYVDGVVNCIISDGNGGYYIGGKFNRVDRGPGNNIVHILEDMSVDLNFIPEVNNQVNALILKDSLLFVGGNFTMINNEEAKYVAAFNIEKNILSNTLKNLAPNNYVNDFALYENNLFIAGNYSEIADSALNGLVKVDLNNSGKIEPFVKFDGRINTIHLHGDSLLIGGPYPVVFSAVNLQTNTFFDWPIHVTAFNNNQKINDISVSDTVVYIAGNFTSVNGTVRNHVAAIGFSGHLLNDFYPKPSHEVFKIETLDENTLAIGGRFETINDLEIPHIAKLNKLNGAVDQSWNVKPEWTVRTFFSKENTLVIGGEFEFLDAVERKDLYAINVATHTLLAWNPESNFFNIETIKADAFNDRVYVGGYDFKTSKNLMAFDGTTGNQAPNWEFLFEGRQVNVIDQDLKTGMLYFGGSFNAVNGLKRENLAAVDTLGQLTDFTADVVGQITAMALSNSKEIADTNLIYIGGSFTAINGEERTNLAAFNAETHQLLDAWKPEINEGRTVGITTIETDKNRVYIAGRFDSINAVSRTGLGVVDAYNGSVLDWDPKPNAQFGKNISEVTSSGVFIINPDLTHVGNMPVQGVAYVNKFDGSLYPFSPPAGFGSSSAISDIQFYNDSLLLLGGSFAFLNEKSHPYFAVLNYNYNIKTIVPETIVPSVGSNTGEITLTVNGTNFTKETEFLLLKHNSPNIEPIPGSSFYVNAQQIKATFDLHDVDTGYYDVALTQPGNDLLIFDNGFLVQAGEGAQTWAEMIAPQFMTTNKEEAFILSYGNTGDVDAIGVPIMVAFSPNIEVISNDFIMLSSMDSTELYHDSIPEFVRIDTLLGKPYKAKVYAFIIPRIPAGSSKSICFKVKGTENGEFYTRAWSNSPMFGSPLKPFIGECYDALLDFMLGFLPYYGCAYGAIDQAIAPLVDYFNDPEFGTVDYAINHMENGLLVALGCGGDLVTGGMGSTTLKMANELMQYKEFIELLEKCEKPEEKEDSKGQFIASFDPNDKTGPRGQGEEGWLNTDRKFPYLIRFENTAEATAPAKQVIIRDTLNPSIYDLSTLEFKSFTIANQLFGMMDGKQSYNGIVDLRPRLPYLVKVEADIDSSNGEVYWAFTTLDTVNQEPITHPLKGFLPPNTDTVSGTGAVFFDVKVHTDLPVGEAIENNAAIFFDYNEPILTNTWKLKADNAYPKSKINAMPDTIQGLNYTISWTGSDLGSGINFYDIMVKKDDELTWSFIKTNTRDTSMVFNGEPNTKYQFISIAYDSALNREKIADFADANTFFKSPANTIHEHEVAEDQKLFNVSPNPANDYLRIQTNNSLHEIPTIKVFDTLGKIQAVQTQILLREQGNQYNMNIQNLHSGVYFINFYDAHMSLLQSEIIIKK